MKQRILLLVLSLSALTLCAQDSKSMLYAIDGTTWASRVDRDKKEELFANKVSLDLQSALSAGRLGYEAEAKKNYNLLQELFHQCRMLFSSIRHDNEGKSSLQNPEFRFFLSQNGTVIRVAVARNGESFNLEEYAQSFDLVLREYLFNAKLVAELANPNGDSYNLDFVISDFQERMQIVSGEVEKHKTEADTKIKSVMSLIPNYKKIVAQQRQIGK